MSTIRTYKVSREGVVQAAQEAIKRAREELHVSTPLVRRLMKVARTAPEFAIGTWYINGRCGCLVGNLLGQKSMYTGAMTVAEELVGVDFDALIRDQLSPRAQKHLNETFDNAVARVRE